MGKLKQVPSRLRSTPQKLAFAPKRAEGFYHSREWLRLMARIKRERGAFCQRCGSGGRIIGDHIVERKDGGAELDESNVELMCVPCHNTKTSKARADRL
jgi:5-methylcytosine-specific restriction endonuclease McrA